MIKRFAVIILCMVFILCNTAMADQAVSLTGKTQAELYSLYLQCDAQEQLLSLADRSSYKTVSDYDDFERNPGRHNNEKIRFTGVIKQVVEGSTSTVYRIAQNNDNDQMFFVRYSRPDNVPRLLENDKVTVYATFSELRSYTSTANLQVTVPQCEAALVIIHVSDTGILSASRSDLKDTKAKILAQIGKKLTVSNGVVTINSSNYGDYGRNPQNHSSEKITYKGTVLQVLEGKTTILRVAVDGNSNQVIYTKYNKPSSASRILEKDTITVTGTFDGLYTYTSTLGGDITIPSCVTEKITVSGGKSSSQKSSFKKDSSGYSYLDETSYEEFNRNAEMYEGLSVRLTGKVLQVIEGNTTASYRIGLENQKSSVVYVTIAVKNRDVRVLQDDTVTVYGTYDGLYSYTSTLKSTITIPSVKATKMTVKGYTAATTKGSSKVTKSNYSDYARNEAKYMNQTIQFSARVVQVIEDSSGNIYRMAVDKNSDCMFLVMMDPAKMGTRILEDDVVKVDATYKGLYTYRSTLGGNITIPYCQINSYTIQGYKQQSIKQSNGVYKVTKSNYQELARNPYTYKEKKISFTGKVLQVVERRSGPNVYRIAVDKNNSCVVYVTYTLPSGSPRILEKDSVTVTGTSTGLYSYTTTLGSSVTIPGMTADKITRK